MKDKELRRLSKRELLDIIYQQKKNEQQLQAHLESAEQKLREREIRISEAGSIAEAALALNGIFEAAQAAADTYLQSVQAANADMEAQIARTEELCAQKMRETDAQIEQRRENFRRSLQAVLRANPELARQLQNNL